LITKNFIRNSDEDVLSYRLVRKAPCCHREPAQRPKDPGAHVSFALSTSRRDSTPLTPRLALLAALACSLPRAALAYRPFDGTDADVAELHELELEIGPVGYYRQGSTHDFEPGGVINFGLFPRVELVLQGFDFVPLDSRSGPNKFTETGLFVKSVWKEGCLQDKPGPSFATELGPLLPTYHDTSGFGAYAGEILSTCFDQDLVVHWNTEIQILPQSFHLDLYAGAIFEPPPGKYIVRPVVEFFVEHEFGGAQTYSGLVGAIWRVSEKLALDFAIREAMLGGQNVNEIRAGFAWAIP
jgi:hypothetical protein